MTPPESASPQDLQHEISLLRRRIADLEQECQSHRTVEQALRRNEELTRRITQSMLGGLVQVGINGQIVYANNEAQRILGMSFDELSQRYVHDFAPVTIHEDGSPYAAEDYPVSRCLRTGQPQTPALIGLKMPDGEVIWALFSAAPLTDPDGKTIGAVVTFLDMTQLRKTQEALRASDEQYRRLIEGVRLIRRETFWATRLRIGTRRSSGTATCIPRTAIALRRSRASTRPAAWITSSSIAWFTPTDAKSGSRTSRPW